MEAILKQPLVVPAAWKGSESASDGDGIFRISHAIVEELVAFVSAIKLEAAPATNGPFASCPMPLLAGMMGDVAASLRDGLGYALMKGLPVARFTDAEVRTLYSLIGSYLGVPVSQTSGGALLVSVRDEGKDIRDGRVRGYQTTAVNEFHVDGSDIVGLLCLKPAKRGGESWIVSAATIYNEILLRHPWYVALLYKDFYFDWRGEEPAGSAPVYRAPLFNYFDERLSCRYSRRRIESAAEKMSMSLSQVEVDLLDLIDELAARERRQMNFEPGDIQFLNNHVVLHARGEYEDYPEEERKRHLLRLWLADPTIMPLPDRIASVGYGRFGVPSGRASDRF